jgi:asparagine synthase (glutamine-hydrolysing)
MCGIAGVVAMSGLLDPEIKAALPAMTSALRHRGPDGDGFHVGDRVALGHRRLAIIDRDGGKQPLANEDRTCWITFNGEIYNHHELRDRLEARGHRFRTRSDTEAIVHAYEEFGPNCVDHLEGMFAFGIYDERAQELFIARDRLGKKPLFYAVLDGVLHFASEIKALYLSPAWNGDVDPGQLEAYLSLGYFLAPGTVYRHVRKLEPGHWLRLCNGRIETRRYWDVASFDTFQGDERAALDLIEAMLDERVRERLESEVPLGAFLSGGIDSGLVVSSMAGASGRVVTTSVGFGDPRHNELEAAGATAAHFDTEHYPQLVLPNLDTVLDPMVEAFDEPFADSSCLPTWYVSREARRHVTVALSGDGGDETFGGYDFRYVPHAVENIIRSFVPTQSARAALGSVGRAWPRTTRLPRLLRLGSFLENIGRDPAAAYYADLCFMKPAAVDRLLGRGMSTNAFATATYEAVTEPYRKCGSADAVQQAEYADLKIYLPNDVLVKVDRMSMQHSLEVRCPLLDRRLVELAFAIPQSLKQAGRKGKHLLKQVANRRLPAAILGLPKKGFTAPVGEWITGPYSDRYRAEVLSPRSRVASLVDLRIAARMFDDHRSGAFNHSYGLWALWMLERWSVLQQRREVPAKTHDGWNPLDTNSHLAG